MKTLKVSGVRYAPFEQMYDRSCEGKRWKQRLDYRAKAERETPVPAPVCDVVEFMPVQLRVQARD